MKANLLIIVFISLGLNLYSQVGIGTTTPSPAAMLEVSSQTNSTGVYRGIMPPRVPDIDARDAILVTAADDGLMVYVQNPGCLQIWNGISWENIHCNNSSALASDLFISEYAEGTVENKALEIANFTGSTVNLDNYRLFISRNGGGNTSIITFNSGFMLANGEVYVIKHTNASASIIANQTDNRIDFNGNDAIVLQTSSGAYIDIMGTVGDDSYFGRNVTLRKKPTWGPSLTYIPTQFLNLGVDDFSGFGSHTY